MNEQHDPYRDASAQVREAEAEARRLAAEAERAEREARWERRWERFPAVFTSALFGTIALTALACALFMPSALGGGALPGCLGALLIAYLFARFARNAWRDGEEASTTQAPTTTRADAAPAAPRTHVRVDAAAADATDAERDAAPLDAARDEVRRRRS